MLSPDAQPLPIAESPAWYDRLALARLNDPRDLVFVHLMFQCAVVGACGIGLFFAGPYLWYLVPAYYLLLFLWVLDRYILMLHCTSHRQLFKRKYGYLNLIIPWILGPFCGETPETYFVHHMGMHHVEGNLPTDLSSTMRYRRSSFRHWLHYYFTFLFGAHIGLHHYFTERGQTKLAGRMYIGEGGYWLSCLALGFVNLQATLAVFVIPVLIVRTLMMMGNWGQHAFVDPRDPSDPYLSAITCIHSRYNRRCFNDGYHIFHHVKPRLHWSEYGNEFENNRAEYGRRGAIVFQGIDFFMVWLYLMTKQWKRLAQAHVQLPGAPVQSEEEIIQMMKSRMHPIVLDQA